MRHAGRLAWLLALLALALSIGSLGVSHATWSSMLFVEGTVDSAELGVEWDSTVRCQDYEQYATITGQRTDPQHITVAVNNGYSGYYGLCWPVNKNTGTIPVRATTIQFTAGPGLTNCSFWQSTTTGSFTATCDQLKVQYTDGLCVVLNPGQTDEGRLRIEVRPGAAMPGQYSFEMREVFEQYNGSPTCP